MGAKLRATVWKGLVRKLPSLTLTRRTFHGKMSFSNEDRVIGYALFVYGAFEYNKILSTLSVLRSLGVLTHERKMLLDVGANIGTVCIPALTSGAFGSALAFEPDPQNVAYLRRNIAQNGLERRVGVLDVALSSYNGEITLVRSGFNHGDHRVTTGPASGTKTELRVSARRLDDLLEERRVRHEDVGLLWMDVQGHEPWVLEGASRLVASGCPVLAEFAPFLLRAANRRVDEVVASMQDAFASFFDMAEEDPMRRDVSELTAVARRYDESGFTDLLLLR